jgi:hypothetical protein
MKDKLDRLRAKRGGYCGVCTKLTSGAVTRGAMPPPIVETENCQCYRKLSCYPHQNKVYYYYYYYYYYWKRDRGISRSSGTNTSAKRKLDKAKLEAKKTGSTNASTVTIQHENGNIATTSSENSSEVPKLRSTRAMLRITRAVVNRVEWLMRAMVQTKLVAWGNLGQQNQIKFQYLL